MQGGLYLSTQVEKTLNLSVQYAIWSDGCLNFMMEKNSKLHLCLILWLYFIDYGELDFRELFYK